MPTRTTLPTALLAALLLAISASANAREQYFAVGFDYYIEQAAYAYVALGGRYGRRVASSDKHGLELYGEVRTTLNMLEDGNTDIRYLVNASGILKYRSERLMISPYIALGLTGSVHRESEDYYSVDRENYYGVGPSLSGGMDWKLSEKWAFKIDATHHLNFQVAYIFEVSFGLSRRFK